MTIVWGISQYKYFTHNNYTNVELAQLVIPKLTNVTLTNNVNCKFVLNKLKITQTKITQSQFFNV